MYSNYKRVSYMAFEMQVKRNHSNNKNETMF